jgi:hypothetical protein
VTVKADRSRCRSKTSAASLAVRREAKTAGKA